MSELIYSVVAPVYGGDEEGQNLLKNLIARVKKNEVTMCHQRGYILPDDVIEYFGINCTSEASVKEKIPLHTFFEERSPLRSDTGKGSFFLRSLCDTYGVARSNDVVSVIYIDNKKNQKSLLQQDLSNAIGKSDVNVVLNRILKEFLTHVIVIVGGKLTHDARTSLLSNPSCRVEIWTYDDLAFDRSIHSMVPRHRICDMSSMIKKVKKSELPEISVEDIQARWIGARVGDLIEITHLSYGLRGLVSGFPRYRLVVGRSIVVHK